MRCVATLPDHVVARVRGSDPIAFLDATTTQDLSTLKPGTGALSCLLDEKGHVLAEFRVLPLASSDVLLDAEPAAHGAITGWLARVAPLSGCEIVDESDDWHAFAVRGEEPTGEHVIHEDGDEIVIGVTWGMPGIDILAHGSAPAPSRAEETGAEEIERARIEAVRPRYGVDVSADLIVNETPLLSRAVSDTKGCYPGQETVAKIRNLGRARRAVCLVHAQGPLRAGTVFEGGTVTSAIGSTGLAIVRAELLEAREATIDGARAELIPFVR